MMNCSSAAGCEERESIFQGRGQDKRQHSLKLDHGERKTFRISTLLESPRVYPLGQGGTRLVWRDSSNMVHANKELTFAWTVLHSLVLGLTESFVLRYMKFDYKHWYEVDFFLKKNTTVIFMNDC